MALVKCQTPNFEDLGDIKITSMNDTALINEIIQKIGCCKAAGFGYIETLMDVFNLHRKELSIGLAGVVWHLDYEGKTHEYSFFQNDNRINLESFDIAGIMNHDGVLNSAYGELAPYKKTTEFELAHTIFLPIRYQKDDEHLFNIKGFIILMSASRIQISREGLGIIYSLISCKSPSTIDNTQVSKAINVLVSDNIKIKELSLKHRHKTLNKALEIMASKGNEDLNKHGLRHFSFWSIDRVGRIYASKEFNKNTYTDSPYEKTTNYVNENNHYVYEYAKYLQEHENEDIEKLIRVLDYDEFSYSIKEKGYFDFIGITPGRSSVVIVPILFESYASVCCFYIRDLIYSPFVSTTFLQELADAIKQRITLVNEINIKNMLSMMMDQPSIIQNHKNYYKDVIKILKDGNEADDCLVYLRNEQNTRYLLVSEEDETNPYTIRETNLESGDVKLYLPEKYMADLDFVMYLKSVLGDKNKEFLYEMKDGKSVKSACLTLINDVDDEYYGFVLLFNKQHSITSTGTYFHNTFYYNNIYIIKACCKYFVLYRNLEFANNRRNTLLIKYRHEMPQCTSAIDQNIRKIKERYKDAIFRIHDLERLANDLLVNCDRIDMLASFFSAIDYDDNRLLDNKRSFSLEDLIKSKIDSFREEASTRGVYVKYDIGIDTPTLQVSIFYQMSVTNLIINAIRYACPGSCVIIRSNSDVIEVVDMGIEVKQSERENIFMQGYRGVEARKVDQRGMGYGLPLTKRIIDAHGHRIEVDSEFRYDCNYFAQAALYHGLSKMEQKRGNQFIYNETYDAEVNMATQLYLQIQKSNQKILADDKEYMNKDEYSLNQWIDYTQKHGPFFLDMEEVIFNKPVYKVSFIIRLR